MTTDPTRRPPTERMRVILNEAAMDPYGEDLFIDQFVSQRDINKLSERRLIERRIDNGWRITEAGRKFVE